LQSLGMKEEAPTRESVPRNLHRISIEAGLTPEQVGKLRQRLLEKRRELVEEHERHLDGGRLPAEEHVAEPEEEAARTNQRETLIGLAESERLRLLEVDLALHKIDDGTYGTSEESGEPIGFDRLRAVPWARFTAVEQEEREREARSRRGA
jgi:RNA polymerase-binding transcription factor